MTDVAPILRPARPEDVSAIAEIWYHGWREAHLGNVPDTLLAVRPRDSFDVRAADRVADTTVAALHGTVAGFVMVDEDEVDQVYVAAEHRGGGVAALLLTAAEERIRANGHDSAWLAVVAGNTRARRFYGNRGWIDEGAFTHAAPGPTGPVAVPAHRYVKHLR
ncbi:GNAT family N-acetyltransferase [Nocardia sp. NBC_00508]|uniref:GNAT family N-acetyltransferase n=1 Tax=Nocardia sp. NBC_00508 TaxID=2975992 RepID=UPI002E8124BA|nr:GNAT family N-acetyltransferase [Nocardia sp. NBC_00508]WUD64642.1 GNAT family N-acetyltransferase [Nocardia sp. NBC_00508]